MEKEDKILAAQIEDRINQCEERYLITNTGFLDIRQQSIVKSLLRSGPVSRFGFYGGFEDAERKICVFLPDYIENERPSEYFADNPDEDPLTVLRAKTGKASGRLSHRDYLGAMMALGIKRELTGDILVRDDGADIIVLKSIAEYLSANLSKAGRSGLDVEEIALSEMKIPEIIKEERAASVASLRLDNVVSAAFGSSRTKAVEAIKAGLIFVNGLETVKPDVQLAENDRIVFRHKGKAVLSSVEGRTAKGRLRIVITRFK